MENISNQSEAPSLNTPTEFSNIEEFSINNESKLKISFNDKSLCFNMSKSSIPPKDYQVILSLEQLYKVNKFFINFENTKELVSWIINALKQKTASIKFIDNKCILQMTNPISNKQLELNLNQKQQDLNSRVTSLENYIMNMEERLKKLESILPEYNKLKKEKEEELEKIFSGSDILNQEAKQMLLNWLPRKPNKITLLLNSNKDGDSTTTFWNKCNGKCPTLAVIQTTKGYIFGGYTTQLWKDGNIAIRDENAFVFSIDKKKKYNIKQPENAIGFNKNSWWGFGYGKNAIVVLDNCIKKKQ